MSQSQSSVLNFPTPFGKETHKKHFLGKKPKGRFPSGTVPVKTVKVDLAVGMYQFHDLLSSHVSPQERNTQPVINDNGRTNGCANLNKPPPDWGYLNMG